MTHRSVACWSLALLSGCAGQSLPEPHSPATFGIDAEASGGPSTSTGGLSGQLSLGVGFEAAECCGLGVYVARTLIKHSDTHPSSDQLVNDITEGGVAITVVVPGTANTLRLRLRGGLAGEPPPQLPSLGRTGYTGGGAISFRVLGANPPPTGQAGAAIDVFGGYSMWAFDRNRTSAGLSGPTFNTGALLFGVRIVTDYGVDFR